MTFTLQVEFRLVWFPGIDSSINTLSLKTKELHRRQNKFEKKVFKVKRSPK